MKYVVDTHTHTIVSGHAYTTLLENVKEASKQGIKLLGTTDHGPNMPGGPHLFYFSNMKAWPRKIDNVTLLRGCEANITDYKGNIDIPELICRNLDIIIASLYDVCIKPGSRDENTEALLNVMDNPYIDIIGHSGNPIFPIWEEKVVKKAKDKNILIEINNGSFGSRAGSEENCYKIAKLCKENGVKLILGSDAHTCFQIGRFQKAESLINKLNISEDLIMNTDELKLISYLKKKGKLKDLELD
ncbi:phosphatase [Clostridium sp. JN-9]|uniref:phosphatase n=1 Tax=Clostridium sp. JN-9 TaxID=2507159 RepID=UPI000FFE0CD5|nr:phosphatase [Clostridium sp. JN-9]QAT41250.1 phosphatase [Clostridium sp. JN-9]